MDYLKEPPSTCGVAIVPYYHHPASPDLQIYESSLRYFSLGLHWADSPYAFPTIGSTIIIHKETYRKIHGFSDRQAAEDFYLLNKAAKVSPVLYRSSEPIEIEGRESTRVPFGTGKAMQAIKDSNFQLDVYNPKIFPLLKSWINILRLSSDEEIVDKLNKLVPNYPAMNKLSKVLKQQCNDRTRIRRRFEFFDAFQTMRFIHHLRDTQFPSIPYQEAYIKAPFISDIPIQDLSELQRYLYKLERERMVGQYYGLSSSLV